ncbi:hypothetical protein [Bacillus salacetis]|uniref:hypothetical protein n=1 Tax=Bacillus salacetis TaxID=2315464 RepID=UPI001443BCC5|nr:hypothetical protein [Bacillus salacetis]
MISAADVRLRGAGVEPPRLHKKRKRPFSDVQIGGLSHEIKESRRTKRFDEDLSQGERPKSARRWPLELDWPAGLRSGGYVTLVSPVPLLPQEIGHLPLQSTKTLSNFFNDLTY